MDVPTDVFLTTLSSVKLLTLTSFLEFWVPAGQQTTPNLVLGLRVIVGFHINANANAKQHIEGVEQPSI
jgi:hypothetical protein